MDETRLWLGAATPALGSVNKGTGGHDLRMRLWHRPTAYAPPRLRLVDTRHVKLVSGGAPAVLQSIDRHLSQAGLVGRALCDKL